MTVNDIARISVSQWSSEVPGSERAIAQVEAYEKHLWSVAQIDDGSVYIPVYVTNSFTEYVERKVL